MVKMYSKSDICKMLAISYRELGKLLAIANIVVTTANTDRRAKLISAAQLDELRSLATLDGQPIAQPQSDLLARFEALEAIVRRQDARIEALERALEDQTSHNAPVTRYDGQETALPSLDVESITHASHRPFPGHRSAPVLRAGLVSPGDTMPGDWLTVQDIHKQYGIPDRTLRDAIEKGHLPAHKGEWKRGRHIVRLAVDPQQLSYILGAYGRDAEPANSGKE